MAARAKAGTVSRRLAVGLTEGEEAVLRAAAERAGVSLARYVAEAATRAAAGVVVPNGACVVLRGPVDPEHLAGLLDPLLDGLIGATRKKSRVVAAGAGDVVLSRRGSTIRIGVATEPRAVRYYTGGIERWSTTVDWLETVDDPAEAARRAVELVGRR